MNDSPPANEQRNSPRPGWILVGFLAVAVFFLFTEHRAHLLGWLPYLLLLACPLMHLFHGHGEHGDHGGRPPDGPPDTAAGSGEHAHRHGSPSESRGN
ncbi:MAG TPA: DUF2933 domain-containing protein [Burkholderiales bacterium]|nr:DUF2933 domain-containing protein [Burkholderiales bacterium]